MRSSVSSRGGWAPSSRRAIVTRFTRAALASASCDMPRRARTCATRAPTLFVAVMVHICYKIFGQSRVSPKVPEYVVHDGRHVQAATAPIRPDPRVKLTHANEDLAAHPVTG